MDALVSSVMPRSENHRWKVLGIGFAANASFAAAFAGIPTTAVVMREAFRFNNAQLGLVFGMLGLGVAVSELPWGMLTDRWGDRKVLLLGLLGTVLALLVTSWQAGVGMGELAPVWYLGIDMLLIGLLGGSVNGSSGRAIMGWFAEGERGLAMSIRQTAVPVGGGIGAVLLPWVAARQGFAAMFALLAALCAVSAGFAWMWLHERALPAARPVVSGRAKTAVREAPWRNLKLWRIAAGIGVLCFPQVAVLSFTALFLHDFRHAGIGLIGLTLVAVQVGAAGMRVWSGRWTDRNHNRAAYLRACSLLSALLFALLGVAVAAFKVYPQAFGSYDLTSAVLIALLVVCGICASAWHGVAFTELATQAGLELAGTALGLGNTCVFACFFGAGVIIPVLLVHGSWAAVWLVGGASALAARVLFQDLEKKY